MNINGYGYFILCNADLRIIQNPYQRAFVSCGLKGLIRKSHSFNLYTMKFFLLALLCLTGASFTFAQTPDKKWNIGLHGGASQYNGDLGNDFYKTNKSFYGVGGISLSRYLGDHFDLNLLATKGEIGYSGPTGKFRQDVTTATLNFRFHILGPKTFIRPYLFVGGGAILFDKNITVTDKKVDYLAPSFGAGINVKLGPSVMLNVQETFLYSTADNREGAVGGKNDMYLFHMVGFTFNFGKKHDADQDGVSDYRDDCADTPTGVAVNKNGCPLDKDKDDVADYIDACPDIAGTVALKGCPDKDSDGIADKDDACPDMAGTAALKGCPDKDSDGVADKDDACPDVKGLAALKGCPDADGDNVADADDKCPGTKTGYVVDATGCPLDNDKDGVVNEEDPCPDVTGPVALKGCPDSDGDGVADNEDRCPQVKGNISNKGCPEISKADVKKITQIASNIFMETGSDKLKATSLAQLDALTEILKRYEAANLVIEGHTDDRGDDASNMALSQKRTEAVKAYLMSKGILESRLTAVGYGETKPIADNKTAAGRAKNRRVELKTSY